MRIPLLVALFLLAPVAFADEPKLIDAPKPPDGFPRFKVQEIDAGLKIGYAVIAVDIDGDKKPDIVVVDQHKVVWYQNPTWKKRVILDGKTKPDNVCITSLDIDGDGLPELVVGAGWKPADTKNPGTLQWLKRGKNLDDEWTMHAIPCDEPTVHRVKVADLDRDGKLEIIMAPLQGRDATAKGNWTDGRPVRILAYKVPKDPIDEKAWKPEVISDELFVVHNFTEVRDYNLKHAKLFAVSYDGLHVVSRSDKARWTTTRVGEGDQSNQKGSRGASEVAGGHVEGVRISGGLYGGGVQSPDAFVGTVEPWHGNKVVVYQNPGDAGKPGVWKRNVIDEQLRWGHAVKFAYLEPPLEVTGNQVDNLIVGVRDNPTKDDKFTEKRGVRLYRNADGKGEKWVRYILEDGGVAVEDLTVADLNGDGKADIVAVGRATGNCRIYWNQGK